MKSSRKAARATGKLSQHPTIAVVGLPFGQAGEVISRCGGVAKLKFVNADHAEAVLPQCDAVFLLTRFAGHRWTAAALQTLPRRRVYLHGEAINTLGDRILGVAGNALLA